jgi:hypothetical protein
MRILAIIPCYKPNQKVTHLGGGEISNKTLFEDLVKKGHLIEVVAMKSGGSEGEYMKGIVVSTPSQGKIFPRILEKLFNIIYLNKHVLLIAKEFNPDVILTGTVGGRASGFITE